MPCRGEIKTHERRYEKRFTFQGVDKPPHRPPRADVVRAGRERPDETEDEAMRCEALRKSAEAKSGRVELFS